MPAPDIERAAITMLWADLQRAGMITYPRIRRYAEAVVQDPDAAVLLPVDEYDALLHLTLDEFLAATHPDLDYNTATEEDAERVDVELSRSVAALRFADQILRWVRDGRPEGDVSRSIGDGFRVQTSLAAQLVEYHTAVAL